MQNHVSQENKKNTENMMKKIMVQNVMIFEVYSFSGND